MPPSERMLLREIAALSSCLLNRQMCVDGRKVIATEKVSHIQTERGRRRGKQDHFIKVLKSLGHMNNE